MIAPVVAATSHTLVRRLPGWEGCGTRVQTMPLALATSTAATRSATCSCASSWIACGSRITGPSPHLHRGPDTQGCPGASVRNRKSEPRAPSTVRDPSRSRPRRQTDSTASTTRNAPASAGNPPRFSRLRGVPARDIRTDRIFTIHLGVPGVDESRILLERRLTGASRSGLFPPVDLDLAVHDRRHGDGLGRYHVHRDRVADAAAGKGGSAMSSGNVFNIGSQQGGTINNVAGDQTIGQLNASFQVGTLQAVANLRDRLRRVAAFRARPI